MTGKGKTTNNYLKRLDIISHTIQIYRAIFIYTLIINLNNYIEQNNQNNNFQKYRDYNSYVSLKRSGNYYSQDIDNIFAAGPNVLSLFCLAQDNIQKEVGIMDMLVITKSENKSYGYAYIFPDSILPYQTLDGIKYTTFNFELYNIMFLSHFGKNEEKRNKYKKKTRILYNIIDYVFYPDFLSQYGGDDDHILKYNQYNAKKQNSFKIIYPVINFNEKKFVYEYLSVTDVVANLSI